MTGDALPPVVMTELEAIQFALRPPKDPEELWWYVRIVFNIHIPRKAVCPDCDAPFDVFCAVYFNQTSELVVVGARGTSKTVMVAILASVIMLTKKVDVSIIAGSKDQAQLVVKYLRNEDSTLAGKLWGAPNAPRVLLDERTESKHQIRTLGTVGSPGNQIFAHAASETSIRGHHPTVVLYDECIASSLITLYDGTERSVESVAEDSIIAAWDGHQFVPVTGVKLFKKGLREVYRVEFSSGRHLLVTESHPFLTSEGWVNKNELSRCTRVCSLPWLREDGGSQTAFRQTAQIRPMSGMLDSRPCIYSASLLGLRCEAEDQAQGGWHCHRQMFVMPFKSQPYKQTSMFGLQSGDFLRGSPVSGVQNNPCISVGPRSCHTPNHPNSRGQGGLHHLWDVLQEPAFSSVPELLGDREAGKSFLLSKSRCPGPRNPRTLGTSFTDRSYCDGDIGGFQSAIHPPISLRSVCGGLLSAKAEIDYRGVKPQLCFPPTLSRKDFRKSYLFSPTRFALSSACGEWPRNGFVAGADSRGFTASADEVISVTPVGMEQVYDLQVPVYHNFVANGIVVHNCDVAEYSDIEHSRGLAMEGAGGVQICSAYFSTWHKYGGTMSRLLDEFRRKESVFNRKYIYSWCWRDQLKTNGGFLSKRYIADKKAQLSEAQWEVEFENKGPQSGTRLFDETMLKSLFQRRLGEFSGVENQWYKYSPDPSKLARHYHGADWARDLHWTVLHTLQKVNMGYQTVAWYRTNHKPYPIICGEVASHVKKFKGPLCHDETGVGKALDDILIVNEKLNRNNVLPMDWSRQKLVKEAAGYYQYAVQNEEICGPHIQFAYSEHEYLTEDMLRGSDHCPDSVAAAMMAYYIARVRHGARSSVSTILRVSV